MNYACQSWHIHPVLACARATDRIVGLNTAGIAAPTAVRAGIVGGSCHVRADDREPSSHRTRQEIHSSARAPAPFGLIEQEGTSHVREIDARVNLATTLVRPWTAVRGCWGQLADGDVGELPQVN